VKSDVEREWESTERKRWRRSRPSGRIFACIQRNHT
jgi:hypothetical protein